MFKLSIITNVYNISRVLVGENENVAVSIVFGKKNVEMNWKSCFHYHSHLNVYPFKVIFCDCLVCSFCGFTDVKK